MGISARQFEEMQQRVQGRKPAGASEKNAETSAHTILLGVDPSLRGTGFGVVKLGGEVPVTLDQGTITVSYTHLTLPTICSV